MSDFIFRLICRWHHNLIVSTCCNNGVSLQKEVFDPTETSVSSPTPESSEEDDVYYDASSSNSQIESS
jgi:hypothetical protein